MFKSKKLITLVALLINLFCASNASAMEEQKETARENLLWSSLEKTTLETELTQKQLNAYTKILTWIYRDDPKVFNETRDGYTPQEFAMYRCHHLIGAAIDRLLKPKHTSYKPTDVEKKKQRAAWAEIYAKETSKIMSKLINLPLEEATGTCTIFLGASKLALIVEISHFFATKRFECRLVKQKSYFHEEVGTLNFTHEGNVDIMVTSFAVNQQHRQNGFGRFLLLTLIEATKLLTCYQAAISLYASPDEYALQPVLINYYKSFGFLPEQMGYESLKLTIKNGSIVYPWEKKSLSLRKPKNSKCRWLNTSTVFATINGNLLQAKEK